jgi:hypothetical protein
MNKELYELAAQASYKNLIVQCFLGDVMATTIG